MLIFVLDHYKCTNKIRKAPDNDLFKPHIFCDSSKQLKGLLICRVQHYQIIEV